MTKPPPALKARIYDWRDAAGNRTPGIGLMRGTSLRGYLSTTQALNLSNDLVDLAEQLEADGRA